MIDSTIVRGQQQVVSGKGGKDQMLGSSRGGLSSKIHLFGTAFGRPVKVLITGEQAHESTAALPLLQRQKTKSIFVNKAYDTNELREYFEKMNAQVIILSKSNCEEPIAY